MKEVDVIDKLLGEIKEKMKDVKEGVNKVNESVINDCMEKINEIENILKQGCPIYTKIKSKE